MGDSRIEWTEKVWNVVTGCSKISPGCAHCYAERMAKRLAGRYGYPADEPFRVTFHPERLEEPLRWRKPARIFVCSMGDLFHEDVPVNYLESVLAVITNCPQHIFMILTKRADRLWLMTPDRLRISRTDTWPIRNLWLGVTAENQEMADKRIPLLLQIPAAVRFVSVEPMLGPVDLSKWIKPIITCNHCGQEFDPSDLTQVFTHHQIPHRPVKMNEYFGSKKINALHWVICGSETGFNRRPAKTEWIRNLRDQCINAAVPFFLKQMEIDDELIKMPKIDDKAWAQFPEVYHEV